MGNRQRVTITDVAKLAGVSTATAARVFNPDWNGNVKAASKEKVLAAAKELGYYGANALAKGLIGRNTNIIAVITAEKVGSFYSKALFSLVDAIRKSGRQVMLFPINPSEISLEKIVAEVHQYCIDAVIITSPATRDVVRCFNTDDVPMILFNRRAVDSNVSSVYCDPNNIGKHAAEFMIQQGLHHLAFITGNTGPTIQSGRLDGFRAYAEENGAELTHVLDGDYSYASAIPLARQMLSSDNRPDGIYCSEDSMAAAVIDVARNEFHLRVPEDLSVIGNDNTPLCEYLNYSITSFAHPLDEMVKSTIEILNLLLEGSGKQYERVYDMKLIVRNSVKLLDKTL